MVEVTRVSCTSKFPDFSPDASQFFIPLYMAQRVDKTLYFSIAIIKTVIKNRGRGLLLQERLCSP